MDVQQDNKGKPRAFFGDFVCSQQEPVSDTASNNNNDTAKEKNVSKIRSRCQLNCEERSLSVYELSESDSMKNPFLVLPKIRKVSRQKHDKEFFCLEIEYGTEKNPFNIFLTITNKSIADQWEDELCKITEQTLTSRRRTNTEPDIRSKRADNTKTLSSPSALQGFSLAEQDGGDVPPTNDDATDETNSEEHEDDTIPTCSNDNQPEPEDTQVPQSSDQPSSGSVLSRPGALRSPGPVYQCTYLKIECSQEKWILTFNKKDFLDTDDIDDMFVCYGESVYFKFCPQILQSRLSQGTRVLQVNKQELVGDDKAHKAIDYIKSSAGQTVDLLVTQCPRGVRVGLCVPSVAALGITLLGNEIMNMHEDGVMSRIADGLRCVCPALSTTDMPSPSAEQRSITAIGDCHVPFGANTEVVKYMLNSAIKSGNGHLVLQLQPTEFCQAIAPNALQRRM